MTWTLLTEDNDGPHIVQTFADVEKAMRRAVRHAQATHGLPTLIELSLEGESVMAIVMGGEWSYAAFSYLPFRTGPRFFTRRRDMVAEKSASPFLFNQFGSQGEMDRECTIPPDEALVALRAYFISGKRPETLPWEG